MNNKIKKYIKSLLIIISILILILSNLQKKRKKVLKISINKKKVSLTELILKNKLSRSITSMMEKG